MYKLINLDWLPAIPENLLGYNLDMEDRIMLANQPRVLKKNGVEFAEGVFRKQQVNPEIEPWLKENIVTDWKEMGYMRMTGVLGPHLDRTRFYVLTYVIKEGGSNVETVYYEPKTNQLDLGMMDSRVDNYDQLQVTEKFHMKEGNWYLLYLHSVEGCTDTRITLQISFVRDPINDGIIKHANGLTSVENFLSAHVPA
jgi:hypothetical protein